MSMVRRDVIRSSADRTFAALDLAPAVALVLALALGLTQTAMLATATASIGQAEDGVEVPRAVPLRRGRGRQRRG